MTSFVLLLVGFLVKAGAVPFHFWLADAYAVAPAPVCVIFAGVMSDLGLHAVARIYWPVFAGTFAPHAPSVRAILVGLGCVDGAPRRGDVVPPAEPEANARVRDRLARRRLPRRDRRC